MDSGAKSYRRFCTGDDQGLAELVSAYKDGLTLYLNGFVQNIGVAEELMEETFFKLITKQPRFQPKYAFKTWLYTIGRNVAIDYLRHTAKAPRPAPPNQEQARQAECDSERLYLMEERKIALHRALKELPADYRQALWLIYFEGFSPAEAAAVMKKTARQMKNLVYRAKGALKTELVKEGFGDEEL